MIDFAVLSFNYKTFMQMQNYVNQLLEDLDSAKTIYPEVVSTHEKECIQTFHIDGKEYFFSFKAETTVEELTGIEQSFLPPVEKLNKQQQQQLVEGILDLWSVFNINVKYPPEMTDTMLYRTFYNYWTETIYYAPDDKHVINLGVPDPESDLVFNNKDKVINLDNAPLFPCCLSCTEYMTEKRKQYWICSIIRFAKMDTDDKTCSGYREIK